MNKQAVNSAAFEKNILNLLKKNKFSGYRTHHGVGGAGIGGLLGAGAGAIDAYTDKDNEELSSEEKMQKYLKKILTYGGAGATVGGGLGALKGNKIRNALAKREMEKLSPSLNQALEHANSLATPHERNAAREAIKSRVHEVVPSISPEEYESVGRDIFKENKQRKSEEKDAIRQQKQQQRAAEREAAQKAEAQKGTFVDGKYVSPDAGNSRTFKGTVRHGVQGARDMVGHMRDVVTGKAKAKAQTAAETAKRKGMASEWESKGMGGTDPLDAPAFTRAAGGDMITPLTGGVPKVEKDQLTSAVEAAKAELKKHQGLLAKNQLDTTHRENVVNATDELKRLEDEAGKYSRYAATGDISHLPLTGGVPKVEKDQLTSAVEAAKAELKKHQGLLAKNQLDTTHRENVVNATDELKRLEDEAGKYSRYAATGDISHLKAKEAPAASMAAQDTGITLEKELLQAHHELKSLTQAAIENPMDMVIIGQRNRAAKNFEILHKAHSAIMNSAVSARVATAPRPIKQPKVKSNTSPATSGANPTTTPPPATPTVDPGAQAFADYHANANPVRIDMPPSDNPPIAGSPATDVTVPKPSGPAGTTNIGDIMASLIQPQSMI